MGLRDEYAKNLTEFTEKIKKAAPSRVHLNYPCALGACAEIVQAACMDCMQPFYSSPVMKHVLASAGSAGFQPCWAGAKVYCNRQRFHVDEGTVADSRKYGMLLRHSVDG
jgi:hypothetical protein